MEKNIRFVVNQVVGDGIAELIDFDTFKQAKRWVEELVKNNESAKKARFIIQEVES